MRTPNDRQPQATRRSFLCKGVVGGTAMAAVGQLPLMQWGTALAAQISINMGIGIHSHGGLLVLAMQQERLLEKAANDLGLDVSVSYQDFQVLLRMLQAIAAGQLQFGQLGSTPNIRALTRPRPAIPIALAGGGYDFALQVAAGSPIRRMDQLTGKTVLTVIGSENHLTLLAMLKAHFGTSDVRQLGIAVRGVQATTELFVRQPGVDAYLGFDPGAFDAQERGILATLVHNYGRTGPHYDGPEGRGDGHELAWFRNATFYPEAFNPNRIWLVVREEFLREQPDAVVATIVANQRAANALARMDIPRLVSIVDEHWPGSTRAKQATIERILWRNRGWVWVTEGDVRIMVENSKFSDLFEQRLEPTLARSIVARGAEVARRAYEVAGPALPEATFVSETSAIRDVRGPPQWQIDRWQLG